MSYLKMDDGRTAAWFIEYSRAIEYPNPSLPDVFWLRFLARADAQNMIVSNALAKARYIMARCSTPGEPLRQ